MQLITESVLLSAAGGLSGIVVARWGLKLLEQLVPQRLDRAPSINTDVLIFSLIVSMLTGILFGLLPALNPPAAST